MISKVKMVTGPEQIVIPINNIVEIKLLDEEKFIYLESYDVLDSVLRSPIDYWLQNRWIVRDGQLDIANWGSVAGLKPVIKVKGLDLSGCDIGYKALYGLKSFSYIGDDEFIFNFTYEPKGCSYNEIKDRLNDFKNDINNFTIVAGNTIQSNNDPAIIKACVELSTQDVTLINNHTGQIIHIKKN